MATRTPLVVAIAILLLPVLYLGSYWALVVPAGVPQGVFNYSGGRVRSPTIVKHYRWTPDRASVFYYPLEQIDRQLRPNAWPDPLDQFRPPDSGILFETYAPGTHSFTSPFHRTGNQVTEDDEAGSEHAFSGPERAQLHSPGSSDAAADPG